MYASCSPPARSFFSHISPVCRSLIVPSPLSWKRGSGVKVGVWVSVGGGGGGPHEPVQFSPQPQCCCGIHVPLFAAQYAGPMPPKESTQMPVFGSWQQPTRSGVGVLVPVAVGVAVGVIVGVLLGVLVAVGVFVAVGVMV